MNTKQIILLGISVLLVGLLIGGAFFFGIKQRSGTTTITPTPTVMAAPTIEETPEPTPTEGPTETPTRIPTPTKKPTSTPTPGPSVTPSPTASPTPTPGVVNIEASVSPTTSNTCTQKFSFSAKIYTNGAATVKYKWLRSDNASAPEQTLTYSGAGVQTVSEDWTVGPVSSGGSMSGWERIQIISGGSGVSNTADFTLTCP